MTLSTMALLFFGYDPERSQRGRRLVVTACVLLVLGAVAVIGFVDGHAGFARYVAAGGLGLLVAVAELVSRYRDEPLPALLSVPAIVYLVVNILASLAALFLIGTFHWHFGTTGSSTSVVQVLTAGFGSAALFRSSLFNITAGDQTIGIGPSTVLNVILNAADRAVDRERAAIRSARAARIMKTVDFERDADALLLYVAAAMQNLTEAEARIVQNRIDSLRAGRAANLPNSLKSYVLGLEVMRFTGYRLLSEAVGKVSAEPTAPLPPPTQPATAGSAPPASVPPDDTPAVLAALNAAHGTILVVDLQKRTGLNYSRVSRAVSELEKQGLIRRTGEPGADAIVLV